MIEIAVGLILMAAAFFLGGRREKKRNDAALEKSYKETIERIENADTGDPDGSGDVDWLRGRAKR